MKNPVMPKQGGGKLGKGAMSGGMSAGKAGDMFAGKGSKGAMLKKSKNCPPLLRSM